MRSIPLEKAMLLWTSTSRGGGPSSPHAATVGKVEIVEHPPGLGGRSKQFLSSYGACNFDDWRKPEKRLLFLFIAFNTLTVRDGMDPKVTHEAFLAIPEYRQVIWPERLGSTSVHKGDIGEENIHEDDVDAEERLLRIFIEFNTLTVCDGTAPKVVHETFLAVPEYRQRISPDQFGATYIDDEGVELLMRGNKPFSQANLEATRDEQEAP